jgi:hypothetical protein
LISESLDQVVLDAWSIDGSLNVGAFSKEQTVYLAYHRDEVFLSE